MPINIHMSTEFYIMDNVTSLVIQKTLELKRKIQTPTIKRDVLKIEALTR